MAHRTRFLLLLFPLLFVSACSDKYGDINITSINASDGLDLKAVGELVKEVGSAEELERKLNEAGGVNNLDLNMDGKVDFIRVTEYGDENTKGFSLTVQPEAEQTQEIATIEIEKSADDSGSEEGAENPEADVYVSGNEQLYGHHHYYHYRHRHSMGSFLLSSYLWRRHSYYSSPYYYGSYPPYYGMGYSRVTHGVYEARTGAYTRSSNFAKVSSHSSSITSPNHGKTASSGIQASLKSPTSAQKSYRAKHAGSSHSSYDKSQSRPKKKSFFKSIFGGSHKSSGRKHRSRRRGH